MKDDFLLGMIKLAFHFSIQWVKSMGSFAWLVTLNHQKKKCIWGLSRVNCFLENSKPLLYILFLSDSLQWNYTAENIWLISITFMNSWAISDMALTQLSVNKNNKPITPKLNFTVNHLPIKDLNHLLGSAIEQTESLWPSCFSCWILQSWEQTPSHPLALTQGACAEAVVSPGRWLSLVAVQNLLH